MELKLTIPGSVKRKLNRTIYQLAVVSRYESWRQQIPKRQAILWEALCGVAEEVTHQLLIESTLGYLDWGLQKYRCRVSEGALIHIYWWMILYQLVLFRTHGLTGYAAEEEFPKLQEIAQQFVQPVWSALKIGMVDVPRPWDEAWETETHLEAAFGLYDIVMAILDLDDGPEEREERILSFLPITKLFYDEGVRVFVRRNHESLRC